LEIDRLCPIQGRRGSPWINRVHACFLRARINQGQSPQGHQVFSRVAPEHIDVNTNGTERHRRGQPGAERFANRIIDHPIVRGTSYSGKHMKSTETAARVSFAPRIAKNNQPAATGLDNGGPAQMVERSLAYKRVLRSILRSSNTNNNRATGYSLATGFHQP